MAIVDGMGHRRPVLPDGILPARLTRGDDLGADARFRIGRQEPGQPLGVLLLLLRGHAGAGGSADRFVGRAQTAVLGRALRCRRDVSVRRHIELRPGLCGARNRGGRDGGRMAGATQTGDALVSGAPVRHAVRPGLVLWQCRRAICASAAAAAHRTLRLARRGLVLVHHSGRSLRARSGSPSKTIHPMRAWKATRPAALRSRIGGLCERWARASEKSSRTATPGSSSLRRAELWARSWRSPGCGERRSWQSGTACRRREPPRSARS